MLNWHQIMQSWDAQLTDNLPVREEQFSVMLNVLETLFGDEFTVLDLACGPASLSQRILTRFPAARCIAADLDPVLMEIGKQVVADNPRITWLNVDLNHPEWSVNGSKPLGWLKTQSIDAILTTTSLHWLAPEILTRVYLQLGELLEEGGVVMNGDRMMFLPHMTTFRHLSSTVKTRHFHQVFEVDGHLTYSGWWESLREQLLEADPATYRPLLEERDNLFAEYTRDFSEAIRAVHHAALSNAGFTEIGPIWQYYDNCVLLAIRGPKPKPMSN